LADMSQTFLTKAWSGHWFGMVSFGLKDTSHKESRYPNWGWGMKGFSTLFSSIPCK